MWRPSLLILMVAMVASPAAATRFDVPAGTLGAALSIIAQTSGNSVGTTSPALLARRVRAVHMDGALPDAVRRMMGDDVIVLRLGTSDWLIITRPPAGSPAPDAAVPPAKPDAIVVTGSKQGLVLDRYPASAAIVDGASLALSDARSGTSALAAKLPIISTTHIGPGQDKLFLGGIADSSVVGTRATTVGQYLGDLRLTYTAPDPNLLLYDMKRIEVLAGPQGTLYGSGAMGGLIRLQPAAPDLAHAGGNAWAGLGATAHGAANTDLGAVVNLPLVDDILGVRGLGYHVVDGGYIDNPELGRRNVNRVVTNGGRAASRLRVGDWIVDVGGLIQSIRSADAQYAEPSVGPLARLSPIREPASDRFALADVVVQRGWDGIDLSSTTGVVHQTIHQIDDATLIGGPIRVYDGYDHVRLISNDTHVSHGGQRGFDWLLGVSLVSSKVLQDQDLGSSTKVSDASHVESRDKEVDLYGRLGLHLGDKLIIGSGLRYARASLTGDASGIGYYNFILHGATFHVGRDERRVLPAAFATYRASDTLSFYTRYERGFRPGGVAAGTNSYRFDSDRLDEGEAGWRLHDAAAGLVFDGALSTARWHNIQADLLSVGLPVTANIGNARILSLDIDASWQLATQWTIEGAMIVNHSHISLAPLVETDSRAVVPDIPDVAARVGLTYACLLGPRDLRLGLNARYIGRSHIGEGAALDLEQGDYMLADATARLALRAYAISLSVDNIFDSHRDSFALGTPFLAGAGHEITPLRPRTVRVGIERRF